MIKVEDHFVFHKNDIIVVGCSTGPDSMALVDLLLKIRHVAVFLICFYIINC